MFLGVEYPSYNQYCVCNWIQKIAYMALLGQEALEISSSRYHSIFPHTLGQLCHRSFTLPTVILLAQTCPLSLADTPFHWW
jgi:hypothetical protein